MSSRDRKLQQGLDAFDREVQSWMPRATRREQITPFVKWREGESEHSVACRTQADAAELAEELLQRSDIEEVFLVLHVKKV